MAVFVFEKRKKPLMPCSQKRARLFLTRGEAVGHPRDPFAMRSKDRVGGGVEPVRVRIDAGSKTTGIAIITAADRNKRAKVLPLLAFAHPEWHPGWPISKAVTARPASRRRRSGTLRGRALRFDNRARARGRLERSYCMRSKSVHGFKTRDMMRAEVAKANQAAIHIGRLAVPASRSFRGGKAEGINAKYCKLLHRPDGYDYGARPAGEGGGFKRGRLA